MKTNFIGTGVAMVTPFTEDKQIDFPAFAKLINDLIANIPEKGEVVIVVSGCGDKNIDFSISIILNLSILI